jgi:hypothetical protein
MYRNTVIDEAHLLAKAVQEGVIVVQYDANDSSLETLYTQIEKAILKTADHKVDSIAFANHGGDAFLSLVEGG